ncbi:Sodium/potassium-transporting ATPase subunit beta-3 [Oryzias melastigma]|uniref:Sodium/potassium-transporting ATPase subunit beta-3 n=1 Tax=Oryzias melastigma TaxID=30732 RepID=A0A834FDU3_ORYME|nr:Sodium/potassium-transporting ATPase subunit beta-3 [Oryzias melastigma]
MWVLLFTLDDYVPRYRDRVPTPGLVIRPNSLDISFNKSDPQKYAQYVQHLEKFLERYNDSAQSKNEECVSGSFYLQDGPKEMARKACPFKRASLSFCSGLSDTNYGYHEGKPCVILKMNRIIGLKPEGEPIINCTVKENYLQPLVAVKLLITKEDYNKELTVECRIDGTNLRNNDERDKFLGRVTFRVKVVE